MSTFPAGLWDFSLFLLSGHVPPIRKLLTRRCYGIGLGIAGIAHLCSFSRVGMCLGWRIFASHSRSEIWISPLRILPYFGKFENCYFLAIAYISRRGYSALFRYSRFFSLNLQGVLLSQRRYHPTSIGPSTLWYWFMLLISWSLIFVVWQFLFLQSFGHPEEFRSFLKTILVGFLSFGHLVEIHSFLETSSVGC